MQGGERCWLCDYKTGLHGMSVVQVLHLLMIPGSVSIHSPNHTCFEKLGGIKMAHYAI